MVYILSPQITSTDMAYTGRYLHLVFLMVTALFKGTKANYTHLRANSSIVWGPDIQSKMGRNQNENLTTNLTTSNVNKKGHSTNMPERAASSHNVSLTPKSELKFYTPSVVSNSSPTVQSIKNTSKNHSDILKKDVCEENNNKVAMLVCLIIIAVLFLLCTLLFLSTVVLANKVSSLRRSKQAGKRQPRSNGDFLANSGLWSAESDTWKRAKQFPGPNLMMQSTGMLTATSERKDYEQTERTHSVTDA